MPTRATRGYVARVAQGVIDRNLESKHVDILHAIANPPGHLAQIIIREVVAIGNGSGGSQRVGSAVDVHSLQIIGRLRPAHVNDGEVSTNQSAFRLLLVRTRYHAQLTANTLGQILNGASSPNSYQGYRSMFTTQESNADFAGPYDVLYDRLYINNWPAIVGNVSHPRSYITIRRRFRRPLKVSYDGNSNTGDSDYGQIWLIIMPSFDGPYGALASNAAHYYGNLTMRIRYTDA